MKHKKDIAFSHKKTELPAVESIWFTKEDMPSEEKNPIEDLLADIQLELQELA